MATRKARSGRLPTWPISKAAVEADWPSHRDSSPDRHRNCNRSRAAFGNCRIAARTVELNGGQRCTVAVADAPAGSLESVQMSQVVALDPGDNTIEIVGYNARNLLAAVSAKVSVRWAAPAAVSKPNLHVLAIGIDDYRDRGTVMRESSELVRWTRALRSAMRRHSVLRSTARRGSYGAVQVTYARKPRERRSARSDRR